MDFIIEIGFGLLGGIILNVMPCVLPVLTLKVFKTVKTLGENPQEARLQSIAYTLGTLVFFAALAAIVLILKSGGSALGWGMHFRQPIFVASLCALIFAFSLNALGVFEITLSSSHSEKDGFWGSVMTGVFAAVMSTPCSAPFLGGAASYALAKDTPGYQTLALFLAIGFGLALPFLLLGFFPAVAKIIPKPGAWMETFKQIMGFTLMGAAVWLFTVLMNQVSADSAENILYFLLLMGVALWGLGHFSGLHHSTQRRWIVRIVTVGTIAAAAFGLVRLEAALPKSAKVVSSDIIKDGKINWVSFDPARIAKEQKDKRLVFLDYTADWCANCKTNEKLFLETDTVREALQGLNVLPMKVDMTNEDPVMDEWLAKVGRSAIPAYAIVYPNGEFDVLPVAITANLVADRLKAATKKL